MPSWKASNSILTEEGVPIKKIAYLPVLPFSCTEYGTVYAAMKNFVSICSQLEQNEIALYCDEKVYAIVEIQFSRPAGFSCIVAMLGTFHTCKALMKCNGKSLYGSGVEDILLEAGGYGPYIIELSILNGKHYNGAFEALSVLAEVLHHFILK